MKKIVAFVLFTLCGTHAIETAALPGIEYVSSIWNTFSTTNKIITGLALIGLVCRMPNSISERSANQKAETYAQQIQQDINEIIPSQWALPDWLNKYGKRKTFKSGFFSQYIVHVQPIVIHKNPEIMAWNNNYVYYTSFKGKKMVENKEVDIWKTRIETCNPRTNVFKIIQETDEFMKLDYKP